MINRIVRLSFKPESVDEFLLLFEAVKIEIANFEGCKGLTLLQDANALNVFYTYSIWTDLDALERYRQSALFSETWVKTKLLFNDKPVAYSTTINQLVK